MHYLSLYNQGMYLVLENLELYLYMMVIQNLTDCQVQKNNYIIKRVLYFLRLHYLHRLKISPNSFLYFPYLFSIFLQTLINYSLCCGVDSVSYRIESNSSQENKRVTNHLFTGEYSYHIHSCWQFKYSHYQSSFLQIKSQQIILF